MVFPTFLEGKEEEVGVLSGGGVGGEVSVNFETIFLYGPQQTTISVHNELCYRLHGLAVAAMIGDS